MSVCLGLLGVAERHLATNKFLAGDEYTIKNMAAHPWILGAGGMLREALSDTLDHKSSTQRWLNMVDVRPAVTRGLVLPKL